MALGTNMKTGTAPKKTVGLLKEIKEEPVKVITATEPTPIHIKDAAILLKPTKRRKIKKTKVYMEGKLTINNVAQFKESVAPVFVDYDYVDFYLKDVTELDLSYIQLLSYYKNCYGPKNEKTVTIDSELPTELKKVIVKSGLIDMMVIPKLV